MTLPPWLVRVGHRSWTFWIPLVLLWPLLLPAALALFALALAARFWAGTPFAISAQVGSELYRLLCALRGTRVAVDVSEAQVVVAFY
jgi:hypothetical protein